MRCPTCQVPLGDPAPSICPFCKSALGSSESGGSVPSAGSIEANATHSRIPADVLEALASGNKIEAIKRYRIAHRGASLKEAKDIVEALAEGRSVPSSASSTSSVARPSSDGSRESSVLPWMLVVAIVAFAAGVGFGVYVVR